jgi:subtilase family serine protease
LRVEELESRMVLTVFTPAQISHAYGIDNIKFGTVKGDGTGQTIAIVDAYDAPNIAADLAFFDNNSKFTLPTAALEVAYVGGAKPAYNSGWAQEITLDVEWAHAIAPGAKILLVEAASNSFADLFGAVDYARGQSGVSVVSMSWGGGEFSGETAYDSHFTTPAGHAGGITFVASAGDTGAVPEYPATSPNVLGVGGSSLTLDTTNAYLKESAWSSSGGGISAYESKPGYQSGVTQSSKSRTSPDVAYDADPNTGVYVYFQGGWYAFGGTSIGAPQWAALVAIADQGRAINGNTSLDSASQTLPAIYNLPSTDFHDVTTGSARNRGTTLKATAGYDLITGRGSPIADVLIPHLVTATSAGVVKTAATGSGGGGSAGKHALQSSPIVSANSAALLVAAMNGSSQSSPRVLPQTPTSSSSITLSSLGFDATGHSLFSTSPNHISAALSSAVFTGGMGSADADGSDDDWDFGLSPLDPAPQDVGGDSAGEADSAGADGEG